MKDLYESTIFLKEDIISKIKSFITGTFINLFFKNDDNFKIYGNTIKLKRHLYNYNTLNEALKSFISKIPNSESDGSYEKFKLPDKYKDMIVCVVKFNKDEYEKFNKKYDHGSTETFVELIVDNIEEYKLSTVIIKEGIHIDFFKEKNIKNNEIISYAKKVINIAKKIILDKEFKDIKSSIKFSSKLELDDLSPNRINIIDWEVRSSKNQDESLELLSKFIKRLKEESNDKLFKVVRSQGTRDGLIYVDIIR